jgi:hypothetical protein
MKNIIEINTEQRQYLETITMVCDVIKILFDDTMIYVYFENGSVLAFRRDGYKKLENATDQELTSYRIIGNERICWPDIDEDIHIVQILRTKEKCV